jgi:hypothetical protein
MIARNGIAAFGHFRHNPVAMPRSLERVKTTS